MPKTTICRAKSFGWVKSKEMNTGSENYLFITLFKKKFKEKLHKNVFKSDINFVHNLLDRVAVLGI